jgi:opacity protein-like surface antigen
MNLRKLLLAASCIMLLAATAIAADPVKVESGLVEGTSENGLTVYRGIPFAAPPVDDLRWRAPQSAAKWDGVMRADKFGPSCMQSMRGSIGSISAIFLSSGIAALIPASDKAQYVNFPGFSNAILLRV